MPSKFTVLVRVAACTVALPALLPFAAVAQTPSRSASDHQTPSSGQTTRKRSETANSRTSNIENIARALLAGHSVETLATPGKCSRCHDAASSTR